MQCVTGPGDQTHVHAITDLVKFNFPDSGENESSILGQDKCGG
jgi:hypothetical protein